MFLKLRRIYNANKNQIWIVGSIMVFLFVLLKAFNNMMMINQNDSNSSEYKNVLRSDYNFVSIGTNKSAITGESISEEQTSAIDVIDSFFNYCNDKNIKEAYNLLTNECKDEMYPKQKDFENGYYKSIFDKNEKNITIENWYGNIYRVNIEDNALTTGHYNKEDNIQDYVTVEKGKDNQYKLNINSYINRMDINKSNSFNNDNVVIDVLRKDIYMDYEIYNIKVTNKMDSTVLLDDLSQIDSLYIRDKNDVDYYVYTYELIENDLIIPSHKTKEISLKFYSNFQSNKQINKIGFSRVILDYDLYKEQDNANIQCSYFDYYVDL